MDKREINIIIAPTTRELIAETNRRGILKEDIVAIKNFNGEYQIFYYG